MKFEITDNEIINAFKERIKEEVDFDSLDDESKDIFQKIVIDKIHEQLSNEFGGFQKQLIIDEIVDQTMSGLAPILQIIKTIASHQMEEN